MKFDPKNGRFHCRKRKNIRQQVPRWPLESPTADTDGIGGIWQSTPEMAHSRKI